MQVTTFKYSGEEALIIRYNETKTDLPLLILLPDINNSLLTEDVINRLAKQNRLTVVQFLSADDKIRQQQIDNLSNRTTFYSDQLSLLTSIEKDSATLLAEGLNANIASGIIHALPINNYVLLNAYFPTLRDVLTANCYAQPTSTCDSIIRFMDFGSRYALDSVFVEISNPSRDNQYGRYTTSNWKDIMPLPSNPQQTLYKGTFQYVFTSNAGLAPKAPSKNMRICTKAKLKDNLVTVVRN